ncbi:hypothetical protein NP493_300g01006 [Ridgeia piscesae]|uniref:Uncharacterized protein n=1 Tax=Ridgeia piscesae TaxID=27915 RepID=A0AAD9L601_RIDPI|nr:hypothetical protein NP493_300g01006 [Ridgeia piscesae]
METLINIFNTAVTNIASEILGKHRPVKKPWITADLLNLCDKRRELKKEKDAEDRWSEHCSELYNYRATGTREVLNIPPATDNDNYPILREEVEAAVKSLKKGKSAGADNVPAELVQAGEKP